MSKATHLNFGSIADIHLKIIIPSVEQCYPGLEASEYNVIIAPGQAPKSVGKQGLILLAETTQDDLNMAVQVGRIINKSPLAFNYSKDWTDDQKPQVGDIVQFAKYGGGVFEGPDGREYRMVKDRDIIGIIPPVDEVKLALAKSLSENQEQKVA